MRGSYKRIAWFAALALAWGGLWGSGAALAGRAPLLPAWNLTVVVEASPRMEKTWLGQKPRTALIKSLGQELRSLPLRVSCGLWLATPHSPRQRIKPSPADHIKDLELAWPAVKAGSPAWGAAIKAALAWLEKSGGGSLLIVTATPPGLPADLIPAGLKNPKPMIFVHALALGAKPLSKALTRLVLLGGGGLFWARKPAELSRVLHIAAQNAISPARLLVHAHGQDNRPLAVEFAIKERDRGVLARPGLGQRPAQLLPGFYGLAWPKDNAPRPGPLPRRVHVAPVGISQVWAGGSGTLAVKTLGQPKGEKPYKVKVTRLRDGKVAKPLTRTPFELELPSGRYLANTPFPAMSWHVLIKAGSKVDLVAGPPGMLTLGLEGPVGKVRLAYEVYSRLAPRRVATGYTNQTLKLPPGDYRIAVLGNPSQELSLTLGPGQKKTLTLAPVGALIVKSRKKLKPVKFKVFGAMGFLASGLGDRPVYLAPGDYRVEFMDGAPPAKVSIKAKATVIINAGTRAR